MSSFVAIGSAVPEKKIFEGFLPHMSTLDILVMSPSAFINIMFPPSIQTFPIKFDFHWPSGCRNKQIFEYYDYIHVYCPGEGTDPPLGSNLFLESIIFNFICPFCPSNDI